MTKLICKLLGHKWLIRISGRTPSLCPCIRCGKQFAGFTNFKITTHAN